MKIKNIETGIIEDVRYEQEGIDVLGDIIGNMDEITRNPDEGCVDCDTATLEWIKDYIDKLETLDALFANMSDDEKQSVLDCTDDRDAMEAIDNRINYAWSIIESRRTPSSR